MGDPLFGMSYDTTKVRFEEAPALVSQLCSELRGLKLWLYAAQRTADAQFYIVSGLVLVRPDGQGPTDAEPDGGDAVEIRGTKCHLSTLDWLLSEKVNPSPTAPKTSKQVVEALLSDALARYVRAFGGKQNFVRALSDSRVSPADLPPILRNQLQAFEKSDVGAER
jgi:hypothetical protein